MTTPSSYRNQNLWVPSSFRDEFIVPIDTLVSQTNPRAAFSRQIDLWWHAIGLGVDAGHRTPLPTPIRPAMVNFIDADTLESDPWRIAHLELLVLGEQGVEAALNPSSVITTANEYALTGFGLLERELRPQVDLQVHLFSLIETA
ncbi:MAG: hypothetical protein OXD31_05225 [Chloroflexi bacterium]|nr:hypothetical protein [Chloroflexota bacterium]